MFKSQQIPENTEAFLSFEKFKPIYKRHVKSTKEEILKWFPDKGNYLQPRNRT